MPADPQVGENLSVYAAWNALRAFQLVGSRQTPERLDAAVSMGVAVEMLLKRVLWNMDPVLLVGSGSGGDALLSRLTMIGRGPRSMATVNSCTPSEALQMIRATRPHEFPTTPDELAVVMNLRNAAAHMAVWDGTRANEATATMLDLLAWCRDKQLVDWPFDAHSSERVVAFNLEQRERRVRLIRERIAEAKRVYQDERAASAEPAGVLHQNEIANFHDWLLERCFLDEDGRPATNTILRVRVFKCCACPKQGSAFYEVSGQPFEHPDDEKIHDMGEEWSGLAFGCPHCGLTLSPTALDTLRQDECKNNQIGWARNLSTGFEVSPWSAAPKPPTGG